MTTATRVQGAIPGDNDCSPASRRWRRDRLAPMRLRTPPGPPDGRIRLVSLSGHPVQVVIFRPSPEKSPARVRLIRPLPLWLRPACRHLQVHEPPPGIVKGRPLKFVRGHNMRTPEERARIAALGATPPSSRKIDREGYVLVKVPGHPLADCQS